MRLPDETPSSEPSPGPHPDPGRARRLASAGDDVTRLLDAVADVPLLTPDEVHDLAGWIEAGVLARERLGDGAADADLRADLAAVARCGQEAYEQMVLANLRLVVSIARQFPDVGVPLGDLVQEGTVGLMRAIEKYDRRRGHRFSTYARWWIRQSVIQALADQARGPRMPVRARSDALSCARERSRLHGVLNREPSPAELAEATGHDVGTVRLLLRSIDPQQSNHQDNDGPALLDQIPATHVDPVDVVADDDRRLDLQHALAGLPADEREVLVALSGWPDGEPSSRRAVADRLGTSRAHVARLAARACGRLRDVPAVARWSDAS